MAVLKDAKTNPLKVYLKTFPIEYLLGVLKVLQIDSKKA